MSRIQKKFDDLRAANKKALITFITAGDPDLDTTKRLVLEMEHRGADIVELGIPYSDPIAEGPVIQAANARALKNGVRTRDVMEAVKELRKETGIPLLFLLYFNCILQYGVKDFFRDCAGIGLDGVIIPDLPFEERDELGKVVLEYPVDVISLVSPTSKERIEKVAKNARGFLYCISSLGVTGVRSSFATNFEEFFSRIDRYSHIPKAIGFGISTPEHVRSLKKYADGLIIGSAIVKQIEKSANAEEALTNVGNLVETLRKAMDE